VTAAASFSLVHNFHLYATRTRIHIDFLLTASTLMVDDDFPDMFVTMDTKCRDDRWSSAREMRSRPYYIHI
jgi:hypothetical protein